MKDVYQLPVVDSATSVVELADGTRRYRKQLVKFGSYVNPNDPGKKMDLDESWARKVINNFQKKITHAPVVAGHPKNSAELLDATKGDLDALSVENGGLWGEFGVKVAETAEGIDKGLVKDVSVSFDPDYLDKRSGERIGPLLRHVGLVNDPYITGMEPFQALSDDANVIMLSESKESTMAVAKLKNERDFPVTVKYTVDNESKELEIKPGEEVEVPAEAYGELHNQVIKAEKPEPTEAEKAAEKEAADKAAADKAAADKEAEDKAAAEKAKKDAELSDVQALKVQLSEAQAQLAKRDANDSYNKLVREGKLVPAQKDLYISLAVGASDTTINLSDDKTMTLSEALTNLINAGPKRISFSEDGKPEGDVSPWDKLTDGEKEATRKQGITPEEYNKYNADETNASEPAKGDDEE